MKSTLKMIAAASVLLLLCGCGKADKPSVEETTLPVFQSVTESEPVLHAEFAIQRFLEQRPDRKQFSDAADGADVPKTVLTVSEKVTDFRVLSLTGEFETDGAFRCTEAQVLYSLPELTPDDLFVLETDLGELLPIRGIRYTDAAGNPHSFYLTVSGEDNIPLIIPFQ